MVDELLPGVVGHGDDVLVTGVFDQAQLGKQERVVLAATEPAEAVAVAPVRGDDVQAGRVGVAGGEVGAVPRGEDPDAVPDGLVGEAVEVFNPLDGNAGLGGGGHGR